MLKQKVRQFWIYTLTSAIDGRGFAALLAILSWLLIIAACSSLFLTPKPWAVQFAYALLGIGAGGIAGAILGFLLGGIGIALAGTAIGIAGWIAGAIFGSSIGALFGLIISFFANPAGFTFHIFKFAIIAVLALGAATFIYKCALTVFVYIKRKMFPSNKELPDKT
jgi:MFS family permease